MGIYKPGFRNIGSFETKIRYAVGFSGFAILAIEIFLVFFYKAAPVYTFLLIPPLIVGFEGILQGRSKFCATYALLCIYDVTDDGRKKVQVKNPRMIKKDRSKMLKIQIYSIAGTLVIFILFVFLYSFYYLDLLTKLL